MEDHESIIVRKEREAALVNQKALGYLTVGGASDKEYQGGGSRAMMDLEVSSSTPQALLANNAGALDEEGTRTRLIGLIVIGLAILDGILLIAAISASGRDWHGDVGTLVGGTSGYGACEAVAPSCCADCDATLGTCTGCFAGIPARRGCCATSGEQYADSVSLWLMGTSALTLIAWLALASTAYGFLVPADHRIAKWVPILSREETSRTGQWRAWMLNTEVPTRKARLVTVYPSGVQIPFQIPNDEQFDPGKGDVLQELVFDRSGEETFAIATVIVILLVRFPVVVALPQFFPMQDERLDCYACQERNRWNEVQENGGNVANTTEILLVIGFLLSIVYSGLAYLITPLHYSDADVKLKRAGAPDYDLHDDYVERAHDPTDVVLGDGPDIKTKFMRAPQTIEQYLGLNARTVQHDAALPEEQDESVPDPRPEIFFETETLIQQGHYQGTNTGETIPPPEISVKNELVTMTTSTVGCHIYYTTNGIPPTAGGDSRNTIWYNSTDPPPVLQIGRVVTYMAIARKPGFYDSVVAAVIIGELPIPILSLTPMPTEDNPNEAVVQIDVTSGLHSNDKLFAVELFYTLDGSEPDKSSFLWDANNRPKLRFTSPDTIAVLVRGFSIHHGDFVCKITDTLLASPISEIAVYDVEQMQNPDVFEKDDETVAIECLEDPTANIRFTNDGTDVTAMSTLYGPDVEVLSMETQGQFEIRSRAFQSGVIPSEQVTLKVMRVHIVPPEIHATFIPGSLKDGSAQISLNIMTHPIDSNKWYTVDGSDPVPNEGTTKLFKKNITGLPTKIEIPSAGLFIRAYADKVGWVSSETSQQEVILRQLPPPHIFREFPSGAVSISCTDENCQEILFSQDGSKPRAVDPNLAWMYAGDQYVERTRGGTQVYNNSAKPELILTEVNSTVVRAMATAKGWIPSEVVGHTMKVTATAPPVFSPAIEECVPGGPIKFRFECGLPNAVAYWSLENINISPPHMASPRHDQEPFTLPGYEETTCTVAAIAHAEGYAPSRPVESTIYIPLCAAPKIERLLPSNDIVITCPAADATVFYIITSPGMNDKMSLPTWFGGLDEEAAPTEYVADTPPQLSAAQPGKHVVYSRSYKAGQALSSLVVAEFWVEIVQTPSITVEFSKTDFSRSLRIHCGTALVVIKFSFAHLNELRKHERHMLVASHVLSEITEESDPEGMQFAAIEAEIHTISNDIAKCQEVIDNAPFHIFTEDNLATKLPPVENGPLLCRAVAFKDGLQHSGICEFLIEPPASCEAPMITRLEPGYELKMETDTTGARIFFSIDGDQLPAATNATPYMPKSIPLLPAVPGMHVVQAIAIKAGMAVSEPSRVELFVSQVQPPVFDILPRDKTNGSTPVMINIEDPLVSIYYTMDGSVPQPDTGHHRGRGTSKSGRNQGTMYFGGKALALFPDRRQDGVINLQAIGEKLGSISSDIVTCEVKAPDEPRHSPPPAEAEPIINPPQPEVEAPPKPRFIVPTKTGLEILTDGKGKGAKIIIRCKSHPSWKIYFTMGDAQHCASPTENGKTSKLYDEPFDPGYINEDGSFTPLAGSGALNTIVSFAVRAIAVSDDGKKSRVVAHTWNFLNGFLTDIIEDGDMKFHLAQTLRAVDNGRHVGHAFSTGGQKEGVRTTDVIKAEETNNAQRAAKRDTVLKNMRKHSMVFEMIADSVEEQNACLTTDVCSALQADHEYHADVLDSYFMEDLLDEAAEWWLDYLKHLKWFKKTKKWSKRGMIGMTEIHLGGVYVDIHTLENVALSLDVSTGEKSVQEIYLYDVKFDDHMIKTLCEIIHEYQWLQTVYISFAKSQLSVKQSNKVQVVANEKDVVLTLVNESWKKKLPVFPFPEYSLNGYFLQSD
jgi:hypothetical protein